MARLAITAVVVALLCGLACAEVDPAGRGHRGGYSGGGGGGGGGSTRYSRYNPSTKRYEPVSARAD